MINLIYLEIDKYFLIYWLYIDYIYNNCFTNIGNKNVCCLLINYFKIVIIIFYKHNNAIKINIKFK